MTKNVKRLSSKTKDISGFELRMVHKKVDIDTAGPLTGLEYVLNLSFRRKKHVGNFLK